MSMPDRRYVFGVLIHRISELNYMLRGIALFPNGFETMPERHMTQAGRQDAGEFFAPTGVGKNGKQSSLIRGSNRGIERYRI